MSYYTMRDQVLALLRKAAEDTDGVERDEFMAAVTAIDAEVDEDRARRARDAAENQSRVGKFYKERDYSSLRTFAFDSMGEQWDNTLPRFRYLAITSCDADGRLSGWSFLQAHTGAVMIETVKRGYFPGQEITAQEFYHAARAVLDLVKPLFSGALPF